MKDLGESDCFLIVSDFVCRVDDDGLDYKGESGFWAKHTIIQNDLYNEIREVHDWSFPVWLAVCPNQTLIQNYLSGESKIIPHDEGEFELIKEDFGHLYQYLGCTISSPSNVQ